MLPKGQFTGRKLGRRQLLGDRIDTESRGQCLNQTYSQWDGATGRWEFGCCRARARAGGKTCLAAPHVQFRHSSSGRDTRSAGVLHRRADALDAAHKSTTRAHSQLPSQRSKQRHGLCTHWLACELCKQPAGMAPGLQNPAVPQQASRPPCNLQLASTRGAATQACGTYLMTRVSSTPPT